MPGRDPKARERSERVASVIREIMFHAGMTGVALRAALQEAGVAVPSDMWITRRLTGHVNLVEPVTVVYGPTDDLKAIAKALGVSVDRLVNVVNVTPPEATADGTATKSDHAAV